MSMITESKIKNNQIVTKEFNFGLFSQGVAS